MPSWFLVQSLITIICAWPLVIRYNSSMQEMLILQNVTSSTSMPSATNLTNSSVPCLSWSGNKATAGGFGDLMASTPVVFTLSTPEADHQDNSPQVIMGEGHQRLRSLLTNVRWDRRRMKCMRWRLWSNYCCSNQFAYDMSKMIHVEIKVRFIIVDWVSHELRIYISESCAYLWELRIYLCLVIFILTCYLPSMHSHTGGSSANCFSADRLFYYKVTARDK